MRLWLLAAYVSLLILWVVVWPVVAVWLAARSPGSLADKGRQFVSTFLPEPWMPAGLIAMTAAGHFIPATFWTPVTWHNPVLRRLGAALVVASSAVIVWVRFTQGRMWAGRPLVQEGHELRTGGPTAWCDTRCTRASSAPRWASAHARIRWHDLHPALRARVASVAGTQRGSLARHSLNELSYHERHSHELGFVLITWPDGESTYQRPPLRLIACPVAIPGDVSATYVYSGQPA